MDAPRRSEPLDAGAREVWPDGGPRPPAELFDQLRYRLARLADNHPSAGAEPLPGEPQGGEPPAESPEGEELRAESPDGEPPADQTGPGVRMPGDGTADAGLTARQDVLAGREAGPDADGAGWPGIAGLADIPLSPPGQDEPYRPWFMTGESLTPWFAADDGP